MTTVTCFALKSKPLALIFGTFKFWSKRFTNICSIFVLPIDDIFHIWTSFENYCFPPPCNQVFVLTLGMLSSQIVGIIDMQRINHMRMRMIILIIWEWPSRSYENDHLNHMRMIIVTKNPTWEWPAFCAGGRTVNKTIYKQQVFVLSS